MINMKKSEFSPKTSDGLGATWQKLFLNIVNQFTDRVDHIFSQNGYTIIYLKPKQIWINQK